MQGFRHDRAATHLTTPGQASVSPTSNYSSYLPKQKGQKSKYGHLRNGRRASQPLRQNSRSPNKKVLIQDEPAEIHGDEEAIELDNKSDIVESPSQKKIEDVTASKLLAMRMSMPDFASDIRLGLEESARIRLKRPARYAAAEGSTSRRKKVNDTESQMLEKAAVDTEKLRKLIDQSGIKVHTDASN